MERNIRKINSKTTLRKEMQTLRREISREKAEESERICIEHLRQSDIYRNHEWVYPYISYQKEMPTLRLIEKMKEDGKRIAVPKVMGEEMAFYEITSLLDCKPACMGILEPVEGKKMVTEPGLMLMPGLAFDSHGGRMGYGGGYYDKYLSRYPYHRTVAWAYDFQIIDQVPMKEHDRRVDYIITPEKGMFSCMVSAGKRDEEL